MSGSYAHRSVRYSTRGGQEYDSGDWYGSEGPSSSQSDYHADYQDVHFRPAIPPRHYLNSNETAYAKDAAIAYDTSRRSSPREARPVRNKERPCRSVTPETKYSPSPDYLLLAKEPPSILADPSMSRKLLILDLNGTLVHRSPHAFRSKVDGPADRIFELPRLRPVHPRPYMPSFRTYLFAPQTKAWLDVMVWSSAQPHSVADMVEKCFTEKKEELVAVWARDTLGLSENNYSAPCPLCERAVASSDPCLICHGVDLLRQSLMDVCWCRKVQTVKDLNKPWSQLPSLITPLPPSPRSSQASTPRSDRSPTPSTDPTPNTTAYSSREHLATTSQGHSALTTLLLDDSPAKAVMQPYNHVCIGEYTGERRTKDLDSLQKEREWELVVAARAQLQASEEQRDERAGEPNGIERSSTPDGHTTKQKKQAEGSSANAASPKKRKRKNRRPGHDLAAEAVEAVSLQEDTYSPSPSPVESPSPSSSNTDDSAIGNGTDSKKRTRKSKRQKKLEALAQKAGSPKPELVYDETLLAVVGVLDEIKRQSNVAAWIHSGGLWGPTGRPSHPSNNGAGRTKDPLTPITTKADSVNRKDVRGKSTLPVNEPVGQAQGPASPDTQNGGKERRRRRRHRGAKTVGEAVEPMGKSVEISAGNDAITTIEPPITRASDSDPPSNEDDQTSPTATAGSEPLWFEHEATVAHWAARGRRALMELEIPIEPGIER